MRLPRPYIPFGIRIQVAERQCKDKLLGEEKLGLLVRNFPLRNRLADLLTYLGDGQPMHLDHDPPLAARRILIHANVFRPGGNPFTKRELLKYDPAANDPNYLIYRTAVEHQIKTNIRGEHGQHPDRVLIKKERRRLNPRKKFKRKWSKRKFPKRRLK